MEAAFFSNSFFHLSPVATFMRKRSSERAEGRKEGAKGAAAAHIAFRRKVAATASEFTRARTPL